MNESRRTIRVLLVDDSPLFIEALYSIVAVDPELEVVGFADNGKHAIEQTQALRPDVIVMDIQMPVMGGLEAITQIMAQCPTPILVCTDQPNRNHLTYEALRSGALDLIPKPSNWPGTSTEQDQLRQRLKLLAKVAVVRHMGGVLRNKGSHREEHSGLLFLTESMAPLDFRAVGIIASTGGPAALGQIVSELPLDFTPSVFIVQHLPVGFAASLVSWLDKESHLNVVLAKQGMPIEPSTVYLAPEEAHLTVDHIGHILLNYKRPVEGHRPSGTLLLKSIAEVYGKRAIGVALTGMGSDGAEGMLAIKKSGGLTIAQDKETSVVFGIPKAAIDLQAAELVLPLEKIATTLVQLLTRGLKK